MFHYSTAYAYATSAFTIRILERDGGWMLVLDGVPLDGPYPTAQRALDELTSGRSAWPESGSRPRPQVPAYLSEWAQACSVRHRRSQYRLRRCDGES